MTFTDMFLAALLASVCSNGLLFLICAGLVAYAGKGFDRLAEDRD